METLTHFIIAWVDIFLLPTDNAQKEIRQKSAEGLFFKRTFTTPKALFKSETTTYNHVVLKEHLV